MRRRTCSSVLHLLVILLASAPPLPAQQPTPDIRVSLIYTGRSLGALGVLRAQDEHELLTEQALAESLEFKGKVATTNRLGTSMLLRVGLTYDRLWKPRYQPFF